MAKNEKIGGISWSLEVEDGQFKKTTDASLAQMGKVAADMQRMSKVKLNSEEWSKFEARARAYAARQSEIRRQMDAGLSRDSADWKRMSKSLGDLAAKERVARKEARYLKQEMDAAAASAKQMADAQGKGRFAEVMGGIKDALPGRAQGAVAAAEGLAASPYAAGAALAVTAITAVGTAAVMGALRLADFAEELDNLTQKTGTSAEYLQVLKFISEQSGLSFDTVVGSITKVQARLKGMEEDSGPAAEAMKQLGISVTGSDGQIRSMDQLLPEIITKLQGVDGITQRNILSAAIFGKGFAEIAPILGMTAEQFDAAAKKAKDLGVVLDAETLASAKELDGAVDELRAQWQGLMNAFASAALPMVRDTLREISEILPTIKDGIESFANALNTVREKAATLHPILKQIIIAATAGNPKLAPIVQGLLADDKPGAKKAGKASAGKGSGNAPGAPKANDTGIDAIASLNRELALNGNSSRFAAMQYEILNGQYKTATQATKDQLLALAKQADAQDAARDAAKKNADAQAKAAEEAKRAQEAATQQQAQQLNKQLDNLRSWAAQMSDALRQFADDTVNEIKSQLQREQEARDRAADVARGKYEKLRELGRAGAMAMTGISMFAKGEQRNGELTPGQLTDARIKAAADSVAQRKLNERAVNARVQGAVFGDSIQQYQGIANSKNGDMTGVSMQQQINYLAQLVQLTTQQIVATQSLGKPRLQS